MINPFCSGIFLAAARAGYVYIEFWSIRNPHSYGLLVLNLRTRGRCPCFIMIPMTLIKALLFCSTCGCLLCGDHVMIRMFISFFRTRRKEGEETEYQYNSS
jgi:hypothetical protein